MSKPILSKEYPNAIFAVNEMFKFVVENEVAPTGIFLKKLIRNAESSNNNELVEYLKSID